MASSNLLVLIDDIATLLDDIAAMTKLAGKKTAGVLGDDLALNAQQVTGINADRELPVVWAVAKGSFKNKFILVPAALAISAFIPWLITPLLMLGGLFLCFEGTEKILHSLFHPASKQQHHDELVSAINNPDMNMLEFEREKIKGAIRTDFILSAEIIAITLGVAASTSLLVQAGVLTTVALLITVIVYGLVAGIVRLDDWGLYLHQKTGTNLGAKIQRGLGYGLLQTAPYLMKTLTIVGTAAMFLVGGGILVHGIPALPPMIENISHSIHLLPSIDPLLRTLITLLAEAIVGIIAGLCICALLSGFKKLKGLSSATSPYFHYAHQASILKESLKNRRK